MTLDQELQSELHKAGERWRVLYRTYSEFTKRRWVDRLRARRLQREADRLIFDERQRKEPIPDDWDASEEAPPSVGPFRFSTGGGVRNIRSTNSLS